MTVEEARALRDRWRNIRSLGGRIVANGVEEEALCELVERYSPSMARGVLERAKLLPPGAPFYEPLRSLTLDLVDEYLRAGYVRDARLALMSAGIAIPANLDATAQRLALEGPVSEQALAPKATAQGVVAKVLKELAESFGVEVSPEDAEEDGW